MDSANKQNGIVSEVTQNSTPATPAYKLLRDTRISGGPQRQSTRSPERRADRMAANMVTNLNTYTKSIEMAYARDAATDILWQSLLNGAFAADVVKNASTPSFFTLEEKYLATTAPYRRTTGCQVNSLALSWRLGEAGQMTWGIMAMGETNATSAIASSTYAAPTPAYDPVSSVDVVVNSMLGLSTPKVTGLSLNINNNMSPLYKFGSADPIGLGLGLFDVGFSLEFYFTAAADYTGFIPRLLAQTFDITIGSVTNFKDKIVMGSVDAFNPEVSDPGATGQHLVTVTGMARYYAGDTAAFKLTRLVA